MTPRRCHSASSPPKRWISWNSSSATPIDRPFDSASLSIASSASASETRCSSSGALRRLTSSRSVWWPLPGSTPTVTPIRSWLTSSPTTFFQVDRSCRVAPCRMRVAMSASVVVAERSARIAGCDLRRSRRTADSSVDDFPMRRGPNTSSLAWGSERAAVMRFSSAARSVKYCPTTVPPTRNGLSMRGPSGEGGSGPTRACVSQLPLSQQ